MRVASPTSISTPPRRFRFGTVEVDEAAAVLRVDGELVPVRPQVFDLLLHLLTHRERIVSREELIERLWPNVVVSRDALARTVWSLRRALGEEEGSSGSWIRTFSKRGYRFVGEVVESSAGFEVPPVSDPASSSGRLLGREQELDGLLHALSMAAAGRGRTCLLRGEPGIGKTRLMDEVLARARQKNYFVFRAVAHELEGTSPFWQWVQVVRGFCETATADERRMALEGSADELLRIAPELARELGQDPRSSPVAASEIANRDDASIARARTFAAIVAFLYRTASLRPLVLGFDDLQWADPGSLRIVSMLIREIANRPIFVLATVRDGLHPPVEAVADLLGVLARDDDALELDLAGLSSEATRILVERHVLRPISPALAAEIHVRTGGNPFFAQEVARVLGEVDEPSLFAQRLDRIPDRVRDAVVQRIGRLEPGARALLSAAALVGTTFDLGTLRKVVSLSDEEFLSSLDAGLAARLIEEIDPVRGTFCFTHALVRETCVQSLPRAERSRLHRRLGSIYEARALDEAGEFLEEVSHHYYEAASLGAYEPAIAYATKAGSRARERLAYEDAAVHFGRALGLLEQHAPERFDERCELSLAMGELARGRGASADEIKRWFRDALTLARRAGSPRLFAQAALGYSNHGGAADPYSSPEWLAERASLLDEALTELGEVDSVLRSRLLAHLAGVLVLPSSAGRRLALSEEALRVAETTGSGPTLAHALVEHAMVLLDRVDDLAARETTIRRALAVAKECGASLVEIEAHVILAGVLLERGELAAGDAEMSAIEAIAERLDQPLERLRPLLWCGMRAALRGQFEEADRTLEAFRSGGGLVFVGAEEVARVQWCKVRLLAGRVRELAPYFDWLRAPRPYVAAAWQSTLCLVSAILGDRAAAERVLAALIGEDLTALPKDAGWLSAIGNLGEASVRLGDAASAEALYEALAPYEGRCMPVGHTIFTDGSVDRVLGRLAAFLGAVERAEGHFEAAHAMHAKMGAPALEVWTNAHHAHALLASGRRSAGNALRREAERMAGKLDMAGAIALVFG